MLLMIFWMDGVTFVQITDSAIIKDKKLGYKYLAKNELIVNKGSFNQAVGDKFRKYHLKTIRKHLKSVI